MSRTSYLAFLLACLMVLVFNGSAQSQDTSNGRKILVDSIVISGTHSIDSSELAEITGALSGSELNDDPDELEERLRDQFQNHGYFQAEVQKFEIKVLDPLASPKPVRIESQVNEGPLCRLSSIEFTGNHAFSSEELRAMFPIKTGDVFKKEAIAGGLERMRDAMGTQGLMDWTAVPETTFSGSMVKLSIQEEEGQQYRMGKLEVVGPAEVAQKLQARWELEPGAIFDADYVKKFLDLNSSLLPADFTESSGVQRFRNCADATVEIHIHLISDAQHESTDRAKMVSCKDTAPTKN